MNDSPKKRRLPTAHVVVITAIATYVALLGWACHEKFARYGYDDFDLAVHAQSVWSITRGSIDCSILGVPFLGNHFAAILFLIAPMYALFPSPLLLLHLQTLVLGVGAWGVFLLAREALPRTWAIVFALVYLAYPPLIYMNLFEFHPIALASTFLIYTMYFYKIGLFRAFLLFLTLALLCQENVALIVAAMGIYALIDGRRGQWFYAPFGIGSVYFCLTVLVIMPRLNDAIQFYSLYGHLGESFAEIAGNIVANPIDAFKSTWSREKLRFLNSLLAPVGYLSLLSPLTLFSALPVLIQRQLSMRLNEAMIVFHYQAEFIPFIFVSAIYGMKRALGWRAMRAVAVIALTVFPIAALSTTGVVPRLVNDIRSGFHRSFLDSRKDEMLARIPHDASVVSTFEFLPRLSGRGNLYSLHHIYSGVYTLSTVPYPTPANPDYVLLNTNDRLTFSVGGFYGTWNYSRIQSILAEPGWEIMENVESLLAFKKTSDPAGPGAQILDYVYGAPEMTTVDAPSDAGIRLRGLHIAPTDENNIVMLTLYWEKIREGSEDYDISLTVADGGVLYQGILSPGSRIWPPQSWRTGRMIADRHGLHIKSAVAPLSNIRAQISLRQIN